MFESVTLPAYDNSNVSGIPLVIDGREGFRGFFYL